MIKLVLIRHGQTDWNVEGRYQGQKDPPLNERGINQAQILENNLSGTKFHAFYTSPLQRCLQTVRIIAASRSIPIYTEPGLMEINQGAWEGQLYNEIRRKYPKELQMWEQQPWLSSPPGGESLLQLQIRVIKVIEDIRMVHRGQIIGVVTHQLPLRTIKTVYQEHPGDILTVNFPNGCHESLEIEDNFQPLLQEQFTLPEKKIF